ncbi:MAG: DinB family protein, partial [Longimicrobiales bacterium]
MSVEAWLRGPLDEVPPHLMPVAHALVQAREDLRAAAGGLSPEQLWCRPGGAASVGFHLRHIAGSLDRLFTYAQGRQLDAEQFAALKQEGTPGTSPAPAAELLDGIERVVDGALETLRETDDEDLLVPRTVGRAQLPSNVLGLLFHAAEHT